jgi:hypothetical protein
VAQNPSGQRYGKDKSFSVSRRKIANVTPEVPYNDALDIVRQQFEVHIVSENTLVEFVVGLGCKGECVASEEFIQVRAH